MSRQISSKNHYCFFHHYSRLRSMPVFHWLQKIANLYSSLFPLSHLYFPFFSLLSPINYQISNFFGTACRYKLACLPADTQSMLRSSFIQFLTTIIQYIGSYFDKNALFYKTISYFG